MVRVRAYTSKHTVKNIKSRRAGLFVGLAGGDAAEDRVEGREAGDRLGLQGSA